MSSETPLSVRIPEQIAAQQGCPPTELSPPLYEVIDLAALEHTLSTAAGGPHTTDPTVTFQYNELTVTVEGTETVDVTIEPTATHQTRSPTPNPAD